MPSKTLLRFIQATLVGSLTLTLAGASVYFYSLPRAAVDPATLLVNLSPSNAGGDLKTSITLHNTGGGTLTFAVSGSCTCTSISPRSGVVPPNSSKQIQLGVGVPNDDAIVRPITVTIRTNDWRKRAISVRLKAPQSPLLVVATPSHVDFGRLSSASLAGLERLVTLTRSEPDIDLQSVLAHTNSPLIQVDCISAASHQVTFRLRLKDLPPSGALYEALSFSGDPHAAAVRVPIYAERPEELIVAPSTVFLRRNAATGLYNPVDVIVSSYSHTLGVSSLRLLDGPAEVTLIAADSLDPHRCRVRLGISDTYVVGEQGARVTIGTDTKGVSVTLLPNVGDSAAAL